jgi:hypothetical protein
MERRPKVGYFKNQLIEMEIEVGDRKPMVYVSTRSFWWTIAAVWVMAGATGFMIGVVL